MQNKSTMRPTSLEENRTLRVEAPSAGVERTVFAGGVSAVHLGFDHSSSSFERLGNNLQVSAADGGTLILENFFAAGQGMKLPALFLADGGVIEAAEFLQGLDQSFDVESAAAPGAYSGSGLNPYSDASGEFMSGVEDYAADSGARQVWVDVLAMPPASILTTLMSAPALIAGERAFAVTEEHDGSAVFAPLAFEGQAAASGNFSITDEDLSGFSTVFLSALPAFEPEPQLAAENYAELKLLGAGVPPAPFDALLLDLDAGSQAFLSDAASGPEGFFADESVLSELAELLPGQNEADGIFPLLESELLSSLQPGTAELFGDADSFNCAAAESGLSGAAEARGASLTGDDAGFQLLTAGAMLV